MGCAAIAKRSLAPAFSSHPNFRIQAIASRTPEKAAEFAARYGARPCNYEALVQALGVDLVYCPLPTGLHYEWVKKCLLAGKHVLCEKSLACSFDEVQDLVGTARSHHCFLMESFQFRFHPQNIYVKQLLAEKTIGDIRQCVVRFGIPPFPDGSQNIRYSRALGGGALLDNGAYTIKAATYLFGCDARVLAALWDQPASNDDGDVDLTGVFLLQAGGVPVHTAYGFDHSYQNGYEIWGTRGMIKTTRAFTARADFAAPVILQTEKACEEKKFSADHFAALLDYVARTIPSGSFEPEYRECLTQAKLLTQARMLAQQMS